MNVNKYEVQFTHEKKQYSLIFYDAGSKGKIGVNGRSYAIAYDIKLPQSLTDAFNSLQGQTFTSDEDLLKKVELSLKGIEITGLIIAKKVYNLATQKLLNIHNYESESAAKLKEGTYSLLRLCSPKDNQSIEKILHGSKCSISVLFDIADDIQKEGKVELAHAIRLNARPFSIESTIASICKQITSHYFDESVAAKCVAHIMKKMEKGAYERIFDPEDFTVEITDDLREVSHDKHFELIIKKEIEKPEKLTALQSENFGFGKLQILEGDICLLEIHSMANPMESFDGHLFALEKAKDILEEMRGSGPSAIIFDLRKNHGGSPYMSELICSYFMQSDLPLSDFRYRTKPEGEETITYPTIPCKSWSKERLPEKDRMLKTPIYILTSDSTFSAAEDLTCHFKERERATIIGETTGGGANPSKLFDAGEKFYIGVPIGQVVVPYGDSWEGTGITPHFQIKAEDAQTKAIELIVSRKRSQKILGMLLQE